MKTEYLNELPDGAKFRFRYQIGREIFEVISKTGTLIEAKQVEPIVGRPESFHPKTLVIPVPA